MGGNPFRSSVVFALILVSFLLVFGCSKKSSNPNPPPAANQVSIKDNFFEPDSLAVDSGATVTWKNQGSASHTVTSDSSGYFSSPTLSTDDSFSFTFQKKGAFKYHCSIHTSMTGKIVVK